MSILHVVIQYNYYKLPKCTTQRTGTSISIQDYKIETINCIRMHSGGKPPLDLLSEESKATQTISGLFITLAFVPELESKTQLLQIPHGADTELGGIKLALTWKPSP